MKREAVWTLPFPFSCLLIKILVSTERGGLQVKGRGGRQKGFRSSKCIALHFYKFTFSSKLMKGQRESEKHCCSWLCSSSPCFPEISHHTHALHKQATRGSWGKELHVMDSPPDPMSESPNPLPNSSFQDRHCLSEIPPVLQTNVN